MMKIKDAKDKAIQVVAEYKKDKPSMFYLLILILVIGAFLRLYRIDEYMTFLGDEGRDVIVVRRLLVDFDPILIGPGTSIGNMYLGPLYYYMMAPALLLANFSPVGPAVMIALLGVVTIFFVWYVAREWFGEVAGLVSASLYAVSPVVIRYSQSSWNPNIMPFFALLTIYSVWRVWQHLEWKWLLIMGIAMAFVLQSHYIGLLLIPVIGVFWVFTFLKQIRSKKGGWINSNQKLIRYSLSAFGIFTLLMSPLVIFDARHGWRNFQAMKIFFTHRQTTVSARPWTAIPDLFDNLDQILTTIVGAGNETVGSLLTYVFVLIFAVFLIVFFKKIGGADDEESFIWRLFDKLNKRNFATYTLLFVWLIVALFGFGVYKQHIYSHYFGFLYPMPALLLGGVAETIWNKFTKIGKYLVIIMTLLLILVNLNETPIKYPPNRQLQRTRQVSDVIIKQAEEEKFNLAVIAERNYEGAYQYFLEKEGAPVVMIDPQRPEETIADQLFVVCELPEDECDPVNNEKAGIANFGWSKIAEKWSAAGVTVYKLVHLEK